MVQLYGVVRVKVRYFGYKLPIFVLCLQELLKEKPL